MDHIFNSENIENDVLKWKTDSVLVLLFVFDRFMSGNSLDIFPWTLVISSREIAFIEKP